jgi:VIT1/CCC1 family predicted Fe2+/Mn2+ transporter
MILLWQGIATLIADGISMGLGEYLSGQAEIDYFHQEKSRERWELENFPEGEIEEMVSIYTDKGIEEDDARRLLTIMARHSECFLDHMMIEVR